MILLQAYYIPIKLKYDCPPASKFGKDLLLWKTATTCFLRSSKNEPSHQTNALSSGRFILLQWRERVLTESFIGIPDEHIEGNLETSHRRLPRWDSCRLVSFLVHPCYFFSFYATSSPAEEFPSIVQEAEENINLALVAALQIDVCHIW